MKKLIAMLALTFVSFTASAAAVDWELSVTEEFATKYNTANVYSYIVSSQDAVTSLVNNWRSGWDTVAGTKAELASLSGWNSFSEGYNDVTSSIVGTASESAYLVLILAANEADANAVYAYTTGLTFRDDMQAPSVYAQFSQEGATDADWNVTQAWAEVPASGGEDPGVPEPTALALLALGVAGLALKRKVA